MSKPAQFCMKTPCKLCPFRKDVRPYIRFERVQNIWEEAVTGKHFCCHETVYTPKKGSKNDKDDWRACAGFMILAQWEGVDEGLTFVQLSERLLNITYHGFLKGHGRVYRSYTAMLRAYGKERSNG